MACHAGSTVALGSRIWPIYPQPTIYVVDDDDAVRDSLKILLESYQLSVRDFGSVPEFLDGLEPVGNSCLVLDLHLPAMGGFDVMNTLARRGVPLPVIVITGRGDAQTRARALASRRRRLSRKAGGRSES